MKSADQYLEDMVSRIRQAVDPDRIVLFGSRAGGAARPDGDFDLLVIKESDEPRHRRAAPLYTKLADLPVEVEIVVYTPGEALDWSLAPEALVTAAIREGKVIYERTG